MDVPSEGQPFFLHLLAEVARTLGDPDWRVLVEARANYHTGAPVGFKKRLPRTPAVFERKRRWKPYDEDDYCLEMKANYKSTDGVQGQIRDQYLKEEAEVMMIRLDCATAV